MSSLIGNATLELFVNVTVRAALELPTATVLKARDVGEALMTGSTTSMVTLFTSDPPAPLSQASR